MNPTLYPLDGAAAGTPVAPRSASALSISMITGADATVKVETPDRTHHHTCEVSGVPAHQQNATMRLDQPNPIPESITPSDARLSTQGSAGTERAYMITDRSRAMPTARSVLEILAALGFLSKEVDAARAYVSRRDRTTHPPGRFDSAGRFLADERLPCCAGLRAPSRAYPYPQMTHCRSLDHVARLHDAHGARVRAAVRVLDELGTHSTTDIGVLQQHFASTVRRSAKAALDDIGDTMTAHERMHLHRLVAPRKHHTGN